MKIKKREFTCICGEKIDTSDLPFKITCSCNRKYVKESPKLLFMSVQEEVFPAGVVII